ncbi:MAG: hypothetical protein U0Y82_07810 [Thermoleophilia bacterium]
MELPRELRARRWPIARSRSSTRTTSSNSGPMPPPVSPWPRRSISAAPRPAATHSSAKSV